MQHQEPVQITAWYEAIWGKVRFNINNHPALNWQDAYRRLVDHHGFNVNKAEQLLRSAMDEMTEEEKVIRYAKQVAAKEDVPLTAVHMEIEPECGYDAIFGSPLGW